MLASLSIETPRSDDFLVIANLERTIQLNTYVGVTSELTHDVVDRHASPEWVAGKEARYRSLHENQAATMRVARLGGQLVGFCMLHHTETDSALAVEPRYQGGAIGPRLIWETARDLRPDTPITLHSVPNTMAFRLYQHLGFALTNKAVKYHQSPHVPEYRIPLVELTLSPNDAEAARQKLERLFGK
jgi:ribosomal protein S18 acetylase RimI-like enzyme